MTMQEVEEVDTVDGSPWHVRLTVVWRSEELPVPIADDARASAASLGVRLSTRPGSCVAHFVVGAASAPLAISRGLARWTDIVDQAGLPHWEIVSFSIEQVDEGELAPLT